MKKMISLLLVLAMVLTMTACGSAPETSTAEPAPKTHIVVDHNGNEVELPYEINRIAVCGILPLPSVIAIFFDSAEKIVGMSGTSMTAAATMVSTFCNILLRIFISFVLPDDFFISICISFPFTVMVAKLPQISGIIGAKCPTSASRIIGTLYLPRMPVTAV